MTRTLLVSLEPNMTLVMRFSGSVPTATADLFSSVPKCSFRSRLRAWAVDVGRLDPQVALFVYDRIVNDVKPAAEKLGYTVVFNGQARLHAKQLAEFCASQQDDLASRISPVWRESMEGTGFKPYQHQLDAVQHWLDNGARGLLGHEMGTGKTLSSILAIHALKPQDLIIYAPASVIPQWREALLTLLDGYRLEIYDGKNVPAADPDRPTALLVSYSKADRLTPTSFEAEMLVCDECHYIKNPKAQRTKAVLKMAKATPFFLALSGTPIVNRPVDLWPVLNLCKPQEFNDWYRFTRKYCNGHDGKFGYVCDGLSKADELNDKLASVMHRVRKDECLDLPAKSRVIIPIDHFQNKLWVDSYYALREQIAEGEAHFSSLRRFLALNKITDAVDWVLDFLQSSPDQKLVVFAHHVEVVNEIIKEVNRRGGAKSEHKPIAVGFTGNAPAEERNRAISRFQEKQPRKHPVRVFVSTIGAAGTGLNLQVASQMLFVETTYSPGEMLQAEDRIHRAGQTQPCTIHYMVETGTYDRVLYRLLTKKMDMMNQVIDGDVTGDLNVFDDLMKEIAA